MHILLQLRVWTTPAQVNQTKYALGVGKDIITYYEQYYNLGYPLPKQGEKCSNTLAWPVSWKILKCSIDFICSTWHTCKLAGAKFSKSIYGSGRSASQH